VHVSIPTFQDSTRCRRRDVAFRGTREREVAPLGPLEMRFPAFYRARSHDRVQIEGISLVFWSDQS